MSKDKIKITIDTNVIGKALKPQSVFRKHVESGNILAFIPETSLTLDGLLKDDKINLLALKNINHAFKQSRWDDFINIGVKFLICPRIGLPRPIGKDSKNKDYNYILQNKSAEHTYDANERLLRYSEVLDYIHDKIQSGQEWLANLSLEIKESGGCYNAQEPWFLNLAMNAKFIGENKIYKRFGDWADADAISAHYAYGNDYFYTDDKASGAGTHSILSENNRTKLKDIFGIKFVSSEEIQHLIS
ncbi:MAG: hypothetical protein PHP65_05505 [Bacilli bacterium]|nr:hypothetical protein [Bacilli bacterium]